MNIVTACGMLLVLAAALPVRAAGPIVILDGNAPGRTFEGLGALSAGASSRLLVDYPEPERSRILDFLFKPNYGASLHHLKVEIGGDVNSTDGTEPSHARTREEFEHPRPEYFQRGYEWWLMHEAKKRNPRILLDVLQWGAPAWVGNRNFWSQDNADLIAAFLRGAKTHHDLDIDFCGLWNERPHQAAWIKLLRQTLDRQGLAKVKIIAADECDQNTMWNIGKEVLADPALAGAVYALGAHYPHFRSTPECVRTAKPLFASEDGPWRGDWAGACALARAYNRNYIEGRMTKTVIWSLISSYYAILPLPNSGPMKALQPWSGHYEVQPAIWVIAHTTQFTRPGWRYLDGACSLLPGQGSYVALRSPAPSGDYSLIVETVDAQAPQTVTFRVTGGLSPQPLHVWRTNEERHFAPLADVPIAAGGFSMTFQPRCIYSLSTTTVQHKGQAAPPPAAEFPCPYADDFESSRPGKLPRYFSDQAGVFEVVRRPDGPGQCLRQVIEKKGIEWQPVHEPYTLLGSANWRNYEVAADVRIERAGSVSLYGRVSANAQTADPPQGYCLTVAADGRWTLWAFKSVLAEGRVAFAADVWHKLKLCFAGTRIRAGIDGATVSTVEDFSQHSGMAGLGSGWNTALYDNFAVQPVTGPDMVNLAQGRPARASSKWSDAYDARFATDGDGSTRWNSAPGKMAGEWLEVDFGRKVRFDTVCVRQFDVRIHRYKIQYAVGGGAWRDATTGDAKDRKNWTSRFVPVEADRVRLLIESVRGNDPQGDTPSVYELEVYDTAAAPPGHE